MADSKKIIISLPNSLLKEVDDFVSIEQKNRSEFIREAMKLYLNERKKLRIREIMKKGYKEMGAMNIALSEEYIEKDVCGLDKYEKLLAESE